MRMSENEQNENLQLWLGFILHLLSDWTTQLCIRLLDLLYQLPLCFWHSDSYVPRAFIPEAIEKKHKTDQLYYDLKTNQVLLY